MCINIVTNKGILYASKVIIITLLSTFGIFETYNNQDLNKSHEEGTFEGTSFFYHSTSNNKQV